MANAWDAYLRGKGPGAGGLPRGDFMQKLRQLVDIDVVDEVNVVDSSHQSNSSSHFEGEVDVRNTGCVDDTKIVQGADVIVDSQTVAQIGVYQDVAESPVAICHTNHNLIPDVSDELFVDNGGIEIARWQCANHNNLKLDVPIYPSDTARLLKMPDDSMMLVYNIGGEGRSQCSVDSLEDAMGMICEDNESTQELYPDLPEALWGRA